VARRRNLRQKIRLRLISSNLRQKIRLRLISSKMRQRIRLKLISSKRAMVETRKVPSLELFAVNDLPSRYPQTRLRKEPLAESC